MQTSDAYWPGLLDSAVVAQETAERDALVAELTRAEHAAIGLGERLRANQGRKLAVVLPDGHAIEGVILEAADTWLLVDRMKSFEQHLIPVTAINSISGLKTGAIPAPRREVSFTTLLRALQRDRRAVMVRTRGSMDRGRIARVGADHMDLEVLNGAYGNQQVIPMAALHCISRAPVGMEF